MLSQVRFRLLHRGVLSGNGIDSLSRSTSRAWLSSKNDGNDENDVNDSSKTFPSNQISRPMRSILTPAPPSVVKRLREENRMKNGGKAQGMTKNKEDVFAETETEESLVADLFDPKISFKTNRKGKQEVKKSRSKQKSFELSDEMVEAVVKVAENFPKQKVQVEHELLEKTQEVLMRPNQEKRGRKKTKNVQSKKSVANQDMQSNYTIDDSLDKVFAEPLFKNMETKEGFKKEDKMKKKQLPQKTSTDEQFEQQDLLELVAETLKGKKSDKVSSRSQKFDYFDRLEDLLKTGKELNIFPPNMETSPELKTWKALEMAHLKRATRFEPINWFDQCMQWTEDGKLWHFPIDNEQGMDEESQVDFTEHIFLDHHIESWCPQEGPIRIFMELVLVGLSKNPYYTVKEKKETLEWYRQYFAKHQGLLAEIGALGSVQNPIEVEVKLN